MSKQGRKWTPEEDGKLLELKAAGKSLSVIARELDRTQAAIDSRTNLLKKMKVTAQ
jgi:DNA-binding NarL/FixJ family response regulator